MTVSVGTPRNETRLTSLLALADKLAGPYASADPFPHTVIDGLFDAQRLATVAEELPRDAPGWKVYDTPTESKRVFDRPEDLGPAARALADELNGSEFVRFLERLTGIDGLIPDPHLTSAGYFDVPTDGFLDIHVDFTRNRRLSLVRRINVLVYLNENWQPEWGGQLELWRSMDDGPVKEIVPLLNRTVVFSTPDAAHGHPKPITAPAGRDRLCFSAYYFTSPDGERPRAHGVRFANGKKKSSRKNTLRRYLPPVVYDGAKALRKRLRREAERSG
jgi:hypothetical protein